MYDDRDDDFDLDDYLHKSKSERKFSYGGIMMTPSELNESCAKKIARGSVSSRSAGTATLPSSS